MENKQTAPKEIFIPSANIEAINARGQKCGMFYTDKKHDTEVKYLSESFVFEILDAKDKQIDGQRGVVQSFKDRYYEQIELIDSKNKELSSKQTEINNLLKIVAERNAEIADKDKQIEELKGMLNSVNGNNVLFDLMQVAKFKNEDGMEVIRYIDKPNGGSIAYVRHDAMVKHINNLTT